MKKSSLAILLSAFAVSSAIAADQECTSVSSAVTTEVTAKPDQVLTIVSEKIAANPTCACEIVKAAISAAKADKDLVGQIVFTAVTAAPTEVTTIAECAVAAAPEASDSIKAALRSAMSDKNPVSEKNPKNVKGTPETPVDDTADFGLSPVAIGGVYLIYPSAGGSGVRLKRLKDGSVVLVGPDGETIFVDEDSVPTGGGRKPRPPQGGGGGTPSPTQGVVVIPVDNAG